MGISSLEGGREKRRSAGSAGYRSDCWETEGEEGSEGFPGNYLLLQSSRSTRVFCLRYLRSFVDENTWKDEESGLYVSVAVSMTTRIWLILGCLIFE